MCVGMPTNKQQKDAPRFHSYISVFRFVKTQTRSRCYFDCDCRSYFLSASGGGVISDVLIYWQRKSRKKKIGKFDQEVMCLNVTRYVDDPTLSLTDMPISKRITYNRKQDLIPGSLMNKAYLYQTDWSGNNTFWY